jgi:hypothetical protein
LVVQVIDVQIGNGPVVDFSEQRHTLGRKHGPNQLAKVVIVQVVAVVDGLEDLDCSL